MKRVKNYDQREIISSSNDILSWQKWNCTFLKSKILISSPMNLKVSKAEKYFHIKMIYSSGWEK